METHNCTVPMTRCTVLRSFMGHCLASALGFERTLIVDGFCEQLEGTKVTATNVIHKS